MIQDRWLRTLGCDPTLYHDKACITEGVGTLSMVWAYKESHISFAVRHSLEAVPSLS
jgi:hypothetical protein